MKPVPLDLFLEQMQAHLDGRRTAAEVEQVVGCSASGTARLALYRTLVDRQQQGVLDQFYAAVRVAAQTMRAGHFERLRDGYLAAHPPSHWAPARAAEHFAGFLEPRGVHPALIELADFAWARHVVLHDATRAIAVRHYTHAVRQFTHQVEHEALRSGVPERAPETWLLGRARPTESLVVLTPSVAALLVLQLLDDGVWPEGVERLRPEVVLAEADALIAQGLLEEGARAKVAACLP